MTDFRIEELTLSAPAIQSWSVGDRVHTNWPVVYTLDDGTDIYIGESLNAAARMRQHLESEQKRRLTAVKVVFDETFNKSACLDLESYLIKLFAGDGKYRVLNRNVGIVDADYFLRSEYHQTFERVVKAFHDRNMFKRSIVEITNADLFKLSPFKALTDEQMAAVRLIAERLLDNCMTPKLDKPNPLVIQGDPGTGKTIIAIYLMKLLCDIATTADGDEADIESPLADLFNESNRAILEDIRIGLVVPQQSLRKSIKAVFNSTKGLSEAMVLSPFQVGESTARFGILFVDETHRLNQRANQPSGSLNRKFAEINARLFGEDNDEWTQLDWIMKQSDQQVLLLDPLQSVRPADLDAETQKTLIRDAQEEERYVRLWSQMRLASGSDYVDYVRRMLSEAPPKPATFSNYEFRLFDDLNDMRRAILEKDEKVGLARMVAGFAWKWITKASKDPQAYDIDIDGCRLRWNSTDTDWISSPDAGNEVGSIHTVQGYDLNYAGVIIGRDLRLDPTSGRIRLDRNNYFDVKGKENNRRRGPYSDEEILSFVTNIYSVLLTRGMRGTYVYVCDSALREYLAQFILGSG